MANGGIAWLLVALAQALKQLEEKIGVTPVQPTDKEFPPLPVTVRPEPSEVVMELPDPFSTNNLEADPVEVLNYKVEKGYKLYLNELSIAPDTTCRTYGRFVVTVGGVTKKALRLLSALTLSWDTLFLNEGSVVGVWVYSTDAGQTCGGQVTMNGRRVRK